MSMISKTLQVAVSIPLSSWEGLHVSPQSPAHRNSCQGITESWIRKSSAGRSPQDHPVQLLGLPRTPNNATLCLKMLSKCSGSLGAVPTALSISRCLFFQDLHTTCSWKHAGKKTPVLIFLPFSYCYIEEIKDLLLSTLSTLQGMQQLTGPEWKAAQREFSQKRQKNN